jgi:Ceramidase
MTLSQHVFLYCERGTSEALLAEPVNAASNAAFLLAGLAGLWLLLRRPKAARAADHVLLIALVFLIGLGSLAFHLMADRVAMLADVVPIDVFMLVYLGFALNRFLGVPPGWTVLTLMGFAAIVGLTTELRCWSGGIGFPDAAAATGASECLNGSLVYLPGLLALVVVGGLLAERKHPAAPYILWAAAVFAVSVTLRSLDLALCDAYVIEGRKIGTHFAWHLLNGLALFLLLRASLEVGPANAVGAVVRPSSSRVLPPPQEAANFK